MRRRTLLSTVATVLLACGRGTAAQDSTTSTTTNDYPSNYYSGMSEIDLTDVVSLSQMYLGVVDSTGSTSWCTSAVAKSVRSAILQCLVSTIPYKCNLYPNTIILNTATCYGDSAIKIAGGALDFSQAGTSVPTNYVANYCVRETIRTSQCASNLQEALPNAVSVTFGTVTLTPTGSPASTPAPSLQYTQFPTRAPTALQADTDAPTKAPTTQSPSPKPTATKTEEPTFTLKLNTDEPTDVMTSEPTQEPTSQPTASVKTQQPSPAPVPATPEPSLAQPTNDDNDNDDEGTDDDAAVNDDVGLPVTPSNNGDDDDEASPSTITASSDQNLMSPFTIAIAAAAGSFLILCIVGGAAYRSRKRDAQEESNNNLGEGDEELASKSSTSQSGRWLFSASVSNIYKTDDSDDAVTSPTRKGFYFGSSSNSSQSVGSPDRPNRSLTEQDHLGPAAEEDEEEEEEMDLEQPSSPSITTAKNLSTSAGSVGSGVSVPFRPLRDDGNASPERTSVSIASFDSMQHSDSEASSNNDMTFSDSSAEFGDPKKNEKYGRKTNMIMKAYKNISPPPEQAQPHSFLWRKKKPFAQFYPLYGGDNQSVSEEDDSEAESEREKANVSGEHQSQESVLNTTFGTDVMNTTDYELDVNWNPDDNSVTSSDRGDEIFSPTVSKEETLLGGEADDEGIEVTAEESHDEIKSWKPSPAARETQQQFFPEDSREPTAMVGALPPSELMADPVMEEKSSPPRSGGIPSTNSSLSDSQSSPRKTPSSHSGSISSGGDPRQSIVTVITGGPKQPPLSPGKRSRVIIDPLSKQGPTVYAVDTVPSEPMPTPRSHFADSGSYTDKPPDRSQVRSPIPRPPTSPGGFLMLPISPDYAEV